MRAYSPGVLPTVTMQSDRKMLWGADRAPDPCLREIKTGMIGKRTAVGRKHALGDADDQYPGEPAAQVDGQTKPRPAVPGGVRED